MTIDTLIHGIKFSLGMDVIHKMTNNEKLSFIRLNIKYKSYKNKT